MTRSLRRLVAVAVTSMACVLASAAPGSASTVSSPLATGLAGPLSIAVGAQGQVYVAQSFGGVLTRVDANGARTDLVTDPGADIEGVSVRRGKVTFAETFSDAIGTFTSTLIKRWYPSGRVATLADTGSYETNRNPDKHVTYGFRHLSSSCASQVPAELGPPKYKGAIDSHPYATVSLPNGTVIVADAAGNDLLRVSRSGHIRTLALLPPIPSVVTAEGAAALGLPDCAIGATYWFEPVPTDVEVGPDGQLYVSLLPGGPEDASLGARGRVYRVNPHNGHVSLVASGFLGATGLAVTPHGTIYVAELFAGQVSRVQGHGGQPVASLPPPAALEWSHGKLYVSYDVFGAGSIATITP